MEDDALKWIWRTLVFARGAVAAIVLVAIADGLFGWDRSELLEFTHAIVVHWQHWLRKLIAPFFGILAFLPEPSQAGLNLFALYLTLLPYYIMNMLRSWKRQEWFWVTSMAFLVFIFGPVTLMLPDPSNNIGRLYVYVTLSFFVLMVVGHVLTGLRFPKEHLERQYAVGTLTALVFVLTLELLYRVPVLEKMAKGVVTEAQMIDAATHAN